MVETDDIILIKGQITSRIKIKEDMKTILEETVEGETFIEETNIEGTIAAIFLTMTTEIITLNNMIMKILKRH